MIICKVSPGIDYEYNAVDFLGEGCKVTVGFIICKNCYVFFRIMGRDCCVICYSGINYWW